MVKNVVMPGHALECPYTRWKRHSNKFAHELQEMSLPVDCMECEPLDECVARRQQLDIAHPFADDSCCMERSKLLAALSLKNCVACRPSKMYT